MLKDKALSVAESSAIIILLILLMRLYVQDQYKFAAVLLSCLFPSFIPLSFPNLPPFSFAKRIIFKVIVAFSLAEVKTNVGDFSNLVTIPKLTDL